MAAEVLAHQLTAEDERTIVRTPADYADHVREMQAEYGDFELAVEQLVADGDIVAVRWRQVGHVAGRPVVELAAVTYRVVDGLIVEYWLLLDRLGVERQLG